jgi:glycosyltransferase involved in cell wall biosynthesis
MPPLIFIHTHPIQYFAPLYQFLTAHGLPLQVWYCSPAANREGFDAEFGTQVKWDLPLMQGYAYRIFENLASKKSQQKRSFNAYKNPAMLEALRQESSSIVVVHGWNYNTYVSLLRHAKFAGHQLAFRGETNHTMEMAKPWWKKWLRKRLLCWLLKDVDYFLYIGTQSKKFYQYLGVPPHKLVHTPYAVDNHRFQLAASKLQPAAVRQQANIPSNAFVFLFSGKYIAKKRPLDLLQAFAKMQDANSYLIMMGEGKLRGAMEQYIRENNLQQKVLLTGFVNQQEVTTYYAAAHAFVMCSDYGETWGLSINEAMNFSLPIIASNRCGSAADLVCDGENGYVFETGNISQLEQAMRKLKNSSQQQLRSMGQKSLQLVNEHSFSSIANVLERLNEIDQSS